MPMTSARTSPPLGGRSWLTCAAVGRAHVSEIAITPEIAVNRRNVEVNEELIARLSISPNASCDAPASCDGGPADPPPRQLLSLTLLCRSSIFQGGMACSAASGA